jgi:cAMP-dependent protein kinase regulator
MADIPVSTFMQGHQEYIQKKVNPVLESMVTQVLLERPDDLVPFMIKWLSEQAGLPANAEAPAHSEAYHELLSQVSFWEKRVAELQEKVEKLPKDGKAGGDEEEEEKESEDEEEDEHELPPPPASYQSKGPRASVSAEAYGDWNKMQAAFEPPVYQKTGDQMSRILNVLESSFLFAALDPSELQVVAKAMQEKVIDDGTMIIRQGDDGDVLYVVEEGTLECYKSIDGNEKMVKVVGPGDAFGELALLYSCPRAASVKAAEKCLLWELGRDTFNHIVKDASAKKREKFEAFLKAVPLLEGMEPYERSKVSDALRMETYEAGVTIVNQGDPGDKFFIIEDGEAIATKSFVQGQIPQEVMQYKTGDYFGELALLHNEPRAANVVAKTAVRVLCLDRRSFKRLLGPLEDILRRNTTRYA